MNWYCNLWSYNFLLRMSICIQFSTSKNVDIFMNTETLFELTKLRVKVVADMDSGMLVSSILYVFFETLNQFSRKENFVYEYENNQQWVFGEACKKLRKMKMRCDVSNLIVIYFVFDCLEIYIEEFSFT